MSSIASSERKKVIEGCIISYIASRERLKQSIKEGIREIEKVKSNEKDVERREMVIKQVVHEVFQDQSDKLTFMEPAVAKMIKYEGNQEILDLKDRTKEELQEVLDDIKKKEAEWMEVMNKEESMHMKKELGKNDNNDRWKIEVMATQLSILLIMEYEKIGTVEELEQTLNDDERAVTKVKEWEDKIKQSVYVEKEEEGALKRFIQWHRKFEQHITKIAYYTRKIKQKLDEIIIKEENEKKKMMDRRQRLLQTGIDLTNTMSIKEISVKGVEEEEYSCLPGESCSPEEQKSDMVVENEFMDDNEEILLLFSESDYETVVHQQKSLYVPIEPQKEEQMYKLVPQPKKFHYRMPLVEGIRSFYELSATELADKEEVKQIYREHLIADACSYFVVNRTTGNRGIDEFLQDIFIDMQQRGVKQQCFSNRKRSAQLRNLDNDGNSAQLSEVDNGFFITEWGKDTYSPERIMAGKDSYTERKMTSRIIGRMETWYKKFAEDEEVSDPIEIKIGKNCKTDEYYMKSVHNSKAHKHMLYHQKVTTKQLMLACIQMLRKFMLSYLWDWVVVVQTENFFDFSSNQNNLQRILMYISPPDSIRDHQLKLVPKDNRYSVYGLLFKKAPRDTDEPVVTTISEHYIQAIPKSSEKDYTITTDRYKDFIYVTLIVPVEKARTFVRRLGTMDQSTWPQSEAKRIKMMPEVLLPFTYESIEWPLMEEAVGNFAIKRKDIQVAYYFRAPKGRSYEDMKSEFHNETLSALKLLQNNSLHIEQGQQGLVLGIRSIEGVNITKEDIQTLTEVIILMMAMKLEQNRLKKKSIFGGPEANEINTITMDKETKMSNTFLESIGPSLEYIYLDEQNIFKIKEESGPTLMQALIPEEAEEAEIAIYQVNMMPQEKTVVGHILRPLVILNVLHIQRQIYERRLIKYLQKIRQYTSKEMIARMQDVIIHATVGTLDIPNMMTMIHYLLNDYQRTRNQLKKQHAHSFGGHTSGYKPITDRVLEEIMEKRIISRMPYVVKQDCDRQVIKKSYTKGTVPLTSMQIVKSIREATGLEKEKNLTSSASSVIRENIGAIAELKQEMIDKIESMDVLEKDKKITRAVVEELTVWLQEIWKEENDI